MKITQPVKSLHIITFQKSFIDLNSTQNIPLKYLGCMLNIAYTHAGVVDIQSNRYSLWSMTSVVVLFTYLIKLNTLTRKESCKFYQRNCITILYCSAKTTRGVGN